MRPDCLLTDMEVPNADCPVTVWSDWSPCSATCGRGVQIRKRLLLLEPHKEAMCRNKIELNQQRPCVLQNECVFNYEEAKEVCSMPAEVGACRGLYKRVYYNAELQQCVEFIFGGCRGNQNNFLTVDDCMKTCSSINSMALWQRN